jgi:outer membrane protein OmpA-like peptidoglycan-associated protein
MKPILSTLLVFLLLMSSVSLFGQTTQLRRAASQYDRGLHFEALQIYKQLLADGHKLDTEHRIRLGHSYYEMNDVDQAWMVFSELEDQLSGYDLFIYASATHKIGFYEGAIELYRKARPQNPTRQGQINDLIRSCEWANQNLTLAPNVLVNPSTILTFGQSFGIQYFEKGVVYSSASPEEEGKKKDRLGRNFLSLYFSDLKDGQITNTRLFSKNLVFPSHTGAISFTSDNKTMYFTRVVPLRGGRGDRVKVFSVEFDGRDWVNERELSINSNEHDNAHPAVSADDKFLYFVSNRPGGYGGKDLWVVERRGKGNYGPARNLGPKVNTFGNEEYPFISKDNTLFFSSDGHTGFGGLDIFRAAYKNGEWTDVQNMMMPFNSNKDDFGYVIDPNDSRLGFLSSNRTGDGGTDDIFYVQPRVEEIRVEEQYAPILEEPVIEPVVQTIVPIVEEPVIQIPETRIDLSIFPKSFTSMLVSTFNGDAIGSANIVLNDAFTGAVIARGISDGNGRINLEIPDSYRREGQDFEIQISKGEFNTKRIVAGILELDEVGKAGISLTPIFKQAELNEISGLLIPYVGENITAEGLAILDKVAAYLLSNPNVVVKLNGHTEARGNRYSNLTVSQTVAEKAEAILVSKGISPDNLIPRGYGERYILNNCRRGKLCDEQEHLANRRVEVVIWRFNQ